MKKMMIVALAIFLASCGATSKKETGDLAARKEKLNQLKTSKADLDKQIAELEAEIAKLDPKAVKEKAKLVSTTTLSVAPFTHFINLQGKIEAEDAIVVAPRAGMGGSSSVTRVFVKKGDVVKAGQVLLKTDASVLEQQLRQLETQLSYAKDLYQRQQNLWNQNIGTEVQLVTARNNVEQVQRQIATVKEQIGLTNVVAPISGIVDELNVKIGETFQGYLGNIPQIKIINTRSGLKVTSQIPENYISKVKKGTPVELFFPDLNKTVKTTISLVSQSIDPASRAFLVEARVPYDAQLKPNLLAQLRIQDYQNPKAIVVPVNVVQSDDKGKYLFVMIAENGRKVARRQYVQIGELYESNIEILGGLQGGETVITEGYQSLYDGQPVDTEVR